MPALTLTQIGMVNKMNFSAVIFDLDGTLVDSNTVWKKIDKLMLEKRGFACKDELAGVLAALTYDELKSRLDGLGVIIPLAELKKELNDIAVFEYENNIKAKKGAADYLGRLKAAGKKIALATGSPRILSEPVLKNNGLLAYFDALLTTDEVGAEKDSPLIYLECAKLLDTKPSECLVFEDSLKALRTAKAAGFLTAAVYDRYSADWSSLCAEADISIKSFDEIK